MEVLSNTFFYLFLLLFLFIAGNILKRSRRGAESYMVLSFIVLLLFFTIRDISVGWDTIPYVDQYRDMDTVDPFDSYLEPGWLLFNKFLYSISHSPNMFFLGTGILGMGAFFFSARKLSSDMVMSVLFYYMFTMYFNLMNQVRCQIAVSICTISFCFLYKKKYIPSMLATIVAFLIHDSALVFFIYTAFVSIFKTLNKKTYAIIILGVVGVFIAYNYLIGFISAYYYTSYFEEERLAKHTKGGNLKIFLILFVVFLFIQLINIIYKRIKKRNPLSHMIQAYDERLDTMLQTAVVFCLCIQLISINNAMIARFGNYFFIYLSILIPNTIEKLRPSNDKSFFKLIFYTLAFAFMIISLAFSEDGYGREGVIPYVINLNIR